MSAISQNFPASTVGVSAPTAVQSQRLPWHCFAVVLAAACIPLGAIWDISWHQTIGRDTFWTPAHMLIYVGGALPGTICGWLVLRTTFGPTRGTPAPVVRLWGFRGSLGGWVAIWGSFAMLVSAPFDNWWHNAYGLDVEILSPPHCLLALGMYGVAIGAMLLVLSWRNRASDAQRPAANFLFLFSCGTLVSMVTVILMEMTFPNQQHGGFFYKVTCAMLPLYPIAAARASRRRWAATIACATYMLTVLAMIWILPLFPGHPMLAPIYNQVTHMVPPPFPILLIFPAIGLDLALYYWGQGRGFWRDTGLALLLGTIFFLLLLAAQWPFSQFLLSPAAQNRFFVGNSVWSYGARVGDWTTQFWNRETDPFTLKSSIGAILIAFIPCRLALWFGNWLSAVKR